MRGDSTCTYGLKSYTQRLEPEAPIISDRSPIIGLEVVPGGSPDLYGWASLPLWLENVTYQRDLYQWTAVHAYLAIGSAVSPD
jgi:hypothetical protein